LKKSKNRNTLTPNPFTPSKLGLRVRNHHLQQKEKKVNLEDFLLQSSNTPTLSPQSTSSTSSNDDYSSFMLSKDYNGFIKYD
tara:strand:- start:428 stop:673 length:246 start_codon:yes stop_codon:yes gene_type:complete